MRPHRSITVRTAFSLIELLVVVAILGLLAVAVLPNLSNTSKTEELRQGTGKLSSFIALAQSRAIGASTPQGLVVRQLPIPNPPPFFYGGPALDLAACEGLAPYSGETYDSRVLVFVPSIAGTTQYYTRDYNGNGVIDFFDETASGGNDRNQNGVFETPETPAFGKNELYWGTPYINLQFGPTAADFNIAAVGDGDLIFFEGSKQPFRLRNGDSFRLRDGATLPRTSMIAELRPEVGDTLATVQWPAGARPVDFDPHPQNWVRPNSDFTSGDFEPLRYEVLRQPTINSGVAEQLTGEACLDTAWTSVGFRLLRNQDPSLINLSTCAFSFMDTTGPDFDDSFDPRLNLCILFNAIGAPTELLQIPTENITPTAPFFRKRLTEPVFILVGRADRVGQAYVSGLNPDVNPDDGCNWQHPDSRWVAIDTNGRVVVAETAPVSSSNWWVALLESQAFIRSDLRAAP